MSIDTLMTGGSDQNPSFGLEHRAWHQVMVDAITPLSNYTQFAIEPAYFDPRSRAAGLPATMWQLKHQNAHDNAAEYLPPFYGSSAVGMNAGQILLDSDLEQPSELIWSLFVNLQLHYAAMLSIGP
jgi:hypothetical protein